MQLPQYERRPREIPRYKPELGYLARFANPYPSTLPQARAPIGEAMGALADGLGSAYLKLQKAEDTMYYNTMWPKILTKTQQLGDEFYQTANPEDPQFASNYSAYVLDGVQKYIDDSSVSGWNPKKTKENDKIMDDMRHTVIIPGIVKATQTHSEARQKEGVTQTETALQYYQVAADNARGENISTADGFVSRDSTVNKFNTAGGTMEFRLVTSMQTVKSNRNAGVINFANANLAHKASITNSYTSNTNNEMRHVDELIATARGSKDTATAIQLLNTAAQGVNNAEADFLNITYVLMSDKDGNVTCKTFWKAQPGQIEKFVYDTKQAGQAQGIQTEVIDYSNLDDATYQKIRDTYSKARQEILSTLGSLRNRKEPGPKPKVLPAQIIEKANTKPQTINDDPFYQE